MQATSNLLNAYRSGMEQLQAMGFKDKEKNMEVLLAVHGNLAAAINRLTSQ